MTAEPVFRQCPVCGASVALTSDQKSPYTVFRCQECGPFSLTNELVADLASGKVQPPDKDVFRDWLKNEAVMESLKHQGPLITAGTFAKIRKALH